ncbi:MAG: hypothetical protein ABI599_04000 [Flavobacteriales bacterium]
MKKAMSGHGGVVAALVLALSCNDPHDRVVLTDAGLHEFQSLDGSRVLLEDVMGTSATLFLTLDPDCPMTQGYVPLFDSLQHVLPTGVRMVGFYPAPFIAADSARRFAQAHNLHFAQLMDAECRLANALRARVTPEAFLVGTDGTVLYRGAIDDSAVREGRKRVASKHFLIDALAAVGGDASQPVSAVAAVGCIVECDEQHDAGQ